MFSNRPRGRRLTVTIKPTRPTNPLLLPDRPAEGLLTAEDWAALGTAFALTARQLTVAILLFEGHTRKAIALRLGKSLRTIRERIDGVFEKLNVSDRLGFAIRILRAKQALTGFHLPS